MNKEYLTIDDTAKKLGVHPKTIRRYISSGKISAQKIAGTWRIYEDSLDNYIRSCEATECNHQHVSKDDFCIFMDSDYFNSEDRIQVCTIVDYYVQDGSVKQLLKDVMEVVVDHSLDNNNSRFNYVYDDADNKMRLVFWGAPTYIEKVVSIMKPYEKV
jgi:excisionase family DNA binding protein